MRNYALEKCLEDLVRTTSQVKAKWIDSQMHRLLPPDVYACAYSGSGRQRMRVQRYLAEHEIRIEERPPEDPSSKDSYAVTNIIMGKVLVAEFRIRLNNGKVECLAKDYPIAKEV